MMNRMLDGVIGLALLKYHARAYLKQGSPSNASGLATGVGFEILAPVKPGNVRAVPEMSPPPGASGFVATQPKPPGAATTRVPAVQQPSRQNPPAPITPPPRTDAPGR